MRVFKRVELLEEQPSDNDNIEYRLETKNVFARIKRLVDANKKSIVAYIGPFGMGKSSVLRTIQAQNKDYLWVEFEMWRYANRSELWEQFVIKVGSEVTNQDEKTIADSIDGGKVSQVKLVGYALVMGLAIVTFFVLSEKVWLWLKADTSPENLFLIAFLKYALPVLLTILTLLGIGAYFNFRFLEKEKPLKRVYELERLLLGYLSEVEKPVVVTVEDSDRTVPDGQIFLETLKSYLIGLRNDPKFKEKSIIVIAPQSRMNFLQKHGEITMPFESSLKIYDEKLIFMSGWTPEGIKKFFISLEPYENYQEQFFEAGCSIIIEFSNQLSVRLVKDTLRETLQWCDVDKTLNPVIVWALILSRYIYVSRTDFTQNPEVASKLINGRVNISPRTFPFFKAIAIGLGRVNEIMDGPERYQIRYSGEEFDFQVEDASSKTAQITLPEKYLNILRSM